MLKPKEKIPNKESIQEKSKTNIDKNILLLRKRFLEIRDMEYVKSVRGGSTGVGATFEAMLGKKEDKLEEADFCGIEIKTKRGYSKSLINLFNASPKGQTEHEVKRIRDTYGYPDKRDKKLKRFNAIIVANELTKVGLFYRFKLRLDRNTDKLILCIYDWNNVCIDESTYWDLATLKEKLIRKLNTLALIKAWPNRIGGIEYFKYYKLNIYLLKEFDYFLEAIETGKIKISFKAGNHYGEEKYGHIHGHGVGFAIAEEDMDSIFEIYR